MPYLATTVAKCNHIGDQNTEGQKVSRKPSKKLVAWGCTEIVHLYREYNRPWQENPNHMNALELLLESKILEVMQAQVLAWAQT